MYSIARRLFAWPRYPLGDALAVIAFAWSYMPLLLPREFWPQGLLSAVMGLIAYQVGVGLTVILAAILAATSQMHWRKWVEVLTGPVSVWIGRVISWPLALTLLVWARIRQNRQMGLLGMDPVPLSNWIAAAVFAWTLVVLVRAAAMAVGAFHQRLRYGRWVVTPLLVVAVTIGGFTFGVRTIDTYTQTTDRSTPEDIAKPLLPEHSGSPSSNEGWEQIGLQGKYFVSLGPSADQINYVMGSDNARTPIRAYASIHAHGTVDATVEAALRELDRTGGWSRKYLVVATATGTGWVNEWGIEAIEYLTRGDCATVSMQYSYLPSVMSILTGSRASEDAGRALFLAVKARIAGMDPQRRPLLLASGESLGAFGGLAAFNNPADMVDSVDLAVFSGTPAFATNYRQLIAQRAPGSSVQLAEIKQYPQIRFLSSFAAPTSSGAVNLVAAGKMEDRQRRQVVSEYGLRSLQYVRETLAQNQTPTQIAFLQHASDPVGRWRMPLAWEQPDWMVDQRQFEHDALAPPDVLWQPAWVPLWTFLGLAADMPGASRPESGHGHSYELDLVATWGTLLGSEEADILRAGNAIFAEQARRSEKY